MKAVPGILIAGLVALAASPSPSPSLSLSLSLSLSPPTAPRRT